MLGALLRRPTRRQAVSFLFGRKTNMIAETQTLAICRSDFPILSTPINGKPLVYLDSAATSQKPQVVLDAIQRYYTETNANVHRGLHTLADRATIAFEQSRARVAAFINAPDPACCIWTRNTTEGINLVAATWGRANLRPGDEILTTPMEHHSNFVPWQMIATATGARVRTIPLTEDGQLDLTTLGTLLTARTKIVALTQASNTLGTINPIAAIVRAAHAAGAVVLVDGAQSVPHMPVDVQALDCDFLAFSAHKMLGPTGIGVLYGKRALLDAMPVYMGGGSMIDTVALDGFTPAPLPQKFEAGTPNIADAVAFTAALDYLGTIGMDAVRAHEREITVYALERLGQIEGLQLYGPQDAAVRGGTISFTYRVGDWEVHPHDLSTILDAQGIAIRAGHHCCQPLHALLDVAATARASFYLYTTHEEIDALVAGLGHAREVFA
jgi:cysteine desulfurase / selenocysteine lyase